MSSGMNTAKRCSGSELMTASSTRLPSLAMSGHSSVTGTPQRIRDWLMSSQPDSRASHLALPVNNSQPTTTETCGPQLRNPSASYDPGTSSWKMYQGWLLADISAPSWATWSRSGIVFDGVYYPQPSWERRIGETGSGYLPTPVDPSKGGGSSRSGSRKGETPTLHGMARKGTWPTPAASDATKWSKQTLKERKEKGQSVRLPTVVSPDGSNPDKLNPEWVELLMAWPRDWTSLQPLNASEHCQWLRGWRCEGNGVGRYGKQPWLEGTWEDGIARIVTELDHRVDRLKALGNGQVPIVAATAWRILSAGLE